MNTAKKTVATALFAMIYVALAATSAPGQAQAQDIKQGAATAAAPLAKPVAAKHARSKKDVDARHCLKLSTNMEIHKCAQKYL